MENLFQKLMLGGSTAALFAAMPAIAQAQDQSNSGDIEQVVVSASRVTIAGYTQPTPVTVVGAAQLEQDAYANIQDSVRELPAVNAPPASFGQSQGAGSPGTAGLNLVNLRNLGSTRTLVLFDGQRVVDSNLTGGVDITTLPSAIIQRVDVVTGGASASWGSDAVAGVVNFILNKNFTGFKADVEGSDTSNGLNRNASVQAAWGGDVFGDRGHLVVAANWNYRPDTTLMVNENWFRGAYWVSNPAYAAGNGKPQLIVANDVGLAGGNEGGIIISNPAGTVAGSANILRGIEFEPGGKTQLTNFGNVTLGTLSNGGSLTAADSEMPFQTIAGENSTYTLFVYGRYKITDSIQASIQLNGGYFTGLGTAQSFAQLGSSAATIHSDNAYLPASVAAAMAANGITSFGLGTINSLNYPEYGVTGANYNSEAAQGLAPALVANRRLMERGVFTLEGALGDEWSWNAYYEHSEVRFTAHILGGDAIEPNLIAAEDAVTVTAANRGTSGLPLGSIACRSTLTGTPATLSTTSFVSQSGCIPLDPFGIGSASPQAVRYITGGDHNYEYENLQQDVMEGSMQGVLPWSLPAGQIAVAFGAGYRKEAGKNVATNLGAQAAYATANYTNFPSSSYNVLEGFAEIDAPLLKNQFVETLDLQAAGRMTSYSTSGLVETWKLGLNSQVIDDVKLRTTWSVDIRAPQLSDLFSPATVNTSNSKDPKSQQTVTTITFVTGNPALNPEVARTISGGVVLTPTFIPGLSLSVDWYHINITGEISTLASSVILAQCDAAQPSPINPGQMGNPSDPICAQHLVFNGPGGALSAITNSELNLASQTTSGMDIQANYTTDFWDGSLALSTTDNYNDEISLTSPGLGSFDYAGTMTAGSAPAAGGPKWKGIVASTYTTGPYSFTVQGRWYGTAKYAENANTGNQATAATANLYDPSAFEAPFTAYLDLRASYKWNDNIQIYGAVDNTTNVPPPLIPPTTSGIQSNSSDLATNSTYYDMLGRTFRVGIRFNY